MFDAQSGDASRNIIIQLRIFHCASSKLEIGHVIFWDQKNNEVVLHYNMHVREIERDEV